MNHELRNTVTDVDGVRLPHIRIEHGHLDLAPVARVDQAGGIDDADAVSGRETTAGKHESSVASWKRDCCPRAHSGPLAGSERHGLGRTQVGARIAGMGVFRYPVSREQNIHDFGHVSRLVQITGKNRGMTQFREKLWPGPGWFAATALVIPASLLALAPISMLAGIITAVVLYGGCVVSLILASPEITVTDGRLRAGKAQVSLDHIGTTNAFSGQEAFQQRGSVLDARAWLLIRAWVRDVVRLEIVDPADPVPYWLLSTRRPNELVAALEQARRPDSDSG